MDQFRITVQNVYTGQQVRDNIYCSGYLIVAGKGRPNADGLHEEGKVTSKGMSVDDVVGLTLDDPMMQRIYKRVAWFYAWLYTPEGLWCRFNAWRRKRKKK